MYAQPTAPAPASLPFKLGDIVQLLCGGPNMVVRNCYHDQAQSCTIATCCWFTTTGDLRDYGFDADLIRLAGSKLN